MSANTRAHSVLQEQESENERLLIIRIPDMHKEQYQIPVSRSSRRYLPASQRSDKGEVMGLVACNECSRTLLCSYHVAVEHMDETADLWSVYFLPPPLHNRFGVSIVPFV